MQESGVIEILPEVCIQLFKGLLFQGTEYLISFSSLIPFWVHCWWSAAVDYNLTLVELSGE